jgi:hypothetical protein
MANVINENNLSMANINVNKKSMAKCNQSAKINQSAAKAKAACSYNGVALAGENGGIESGKLYGGNVWYRKKIIEGWRNGNNENIMKAEMAASYLAAKYQCGEIINNIEIKISISISIKRNNNNGINEYQ